MYVSAPVVKVTEASQQTISVFIRAVLCSKKILCLLLQEKLSEQAVFMLQVFHLSPALCWIQLILNCLSVLWPAKKQKTLPAKNACLNRIETGLQKPCVVRKQKSSAKTERRKKKRQHSQDFQTTTNHLQKIHFLWEDFFLQQKKSKEKRLLYCHLKIFFLHSKMKRIKIN